jgi:RimJ/RimL family protein N-acetyltransferase
MHISIRPLLASDAENIVKYGNNYEIAKKLTDQFPHPYTLEKAEGFIEKVSENNPSNIMGIIYDGELIGIIGLHLQSDVFRMNAELGYWIGQPFWGKGIMTTVIQKMVKYSFENFDITRIFARPYGSNIGSQKALEKAGFKLEAKFEKILIKNNVFEDELVYAIRKV